MHGGPATPPETARRLFGPIAPTYERWARILSMGQDGRWRRAMTEGLELQRGSRVLDVAAGTGSISRLLAERGFDVVSLDQSPEMVSLAAKRGAVAVLGAAEGLPFATGSFDGVTFGYLLRYVDSVPGCLRELARVVRPGGSVGMVEFGRPTGVWSLPWQAYTRVVLPAAGALVGKGWPEVGRFLGRSIDDFARRYPPERLAAVCSDAGFEKVRFREMSLGGGLAMWARRL